MKPKKTSTLSETEYLLASEANAKRLAQSIEQLRRGETFEHDLIEPVENENNKTCSDKDI